jgi:enamine deaminase RidA (YjgF/YER057c/UK114 family)
LVGSSDFAAQAEQVFRNLSIALQSTGCAANNLVELTVFLRNMENLSAYRGSNCNFCVQRRHVIGSFQRLLGLQLRRLLGRSVKLDGPDFLIEIEAIAVA